MERSLYEEHADLEQTHWWFVGRRAVVAGVLDRWLAPTTSRRRIIDAGSGTGGMLPLLSAYGDVRGIESEPIAVEWSRANYPDHPVTVGDLPDDLPSDVEVDLITAFDVIEHLDDDVHVLRAMRGRLRPDGALVVTVPALPWLWSNHDDRNGHRRRYTMKSLRGALEAGGYCIDHISSFNTVLLPAVAAVRATQRFRRSVDDASSDFTMPNRLVNRVLTMVFSLERRWVARLRIPLGVSIIAVARPA
jgi:SAM-dependent methyltransferase